MQWTSCKTILKKSHCTCGGTPLQDSLSLTVTRFPAHVWGPCYKVPAIDSYEKITLHMWGGPCYKVPTFNSYHTCGGSHYMVPIIDSYKVPTFRSYHTCGGPHYKVTIINSYKVPTFTSYHTCGRGPVIRFPHSI